MWAGSLLQKSPDALTYLAMLNSGEAITVAGIAFGVLSVGPAIFFLRLSCGGHIMSFLQ